MDDRIDARHRVADGVKVPQVSLPNVIHASRRSAGEASHLMSSSRQFTTGFTPDGPG
jgi:hypothetical protein